MHCTAQDHLRAGYEQETSRCRCGAGSLRDLAARWPTRRPVAGQGDETPGISYRTCLLSGRTAESNSLVDVAAVDSLDSFVGVLARAFPRSLASDVAAVARIIPSASYALADRFVVSVAQEELSIPGRIYNAEPDAGVGELTPGAQLVLHCIYTRHHDGYVRQRHLAYIVGAINLWVPAYVVRLAGEYIVEVIESIAAGLSELTVPGSDQRAAYGRFASENARFIDLTDARAASYWNEYYRARYQRLADYPGRVLLADLRSAGRDYARAAS
jgi:hypothetical protein